MPRLLAPLLIAALLAGASTPEPSLAQTGARRSAGQSGAGGCSYSDWSAPEPIEGAPSGAVAWPSLTVRGGRGFVVGNDVPFFDEETLVGEGPLVALALPGGNIGKPAGDFAFAFPKAAVNEAGTLHVVWAEPADAHPRTGREWSELGYRRRRLGSLWYAAYDSARGWTVPEQVYLGRALIWAHAFASVTLDAADRLQVAVMNLPHGGVVGELLPPDVLVHLVRDAGAWHRAEVILQTATYPNVAAMRDGRVYIAYIAPDTTVRRDLGSVFLIRSLDGGRSWEPPQLISHLATPRRAVEVTAHATRDGALHLVWSQNKSPLQGELVRHAVSRDGGETWIPSAPLEPNGGFHTLRAVADRCGAIHVIYMRWVPHPTSADEIVSELWYARRDRAWTTPQRPFPHLSVSSAALAAAPNGSVHLFLSGRPVAATGYTPYVPMTSEVRIRAPEAAGEEAPR